MRNVTLRPASLLCRFIRARAFADALNLTPLSVFSGFLNIFFSLSYILKCFKLNTSELVISLFILSWNGIITNYLWHVPCCIEKRTWSSFISLGSRFELDISLAILSCSFCRSSGRNRVSVPLRMCSLVSFNVSSNLSTILGYFAGIDTRPRVPRFRSFSLMSMNVWENLYDKK